jgi:hypothetical protein
MVVNVEAKADEPFGDDMIGDYYDRTADSRSNVPARIRQLSLALFGRVPDAAIRRLRYQLLHAAAGTLIEAAANKAEFGLFLVHEFRCPRLNEKKLTQNSEQHRLGELCPRISRTCGGSGEEEPDSRSSYRTGRGPRAALHPALSGNWSLSLSRLNRKSDCQCAYQSDCGDHLPHLRHWVEVYWRRQAGHTLYRRCSNRARRHKTIGLLVSFAGRPAAQRAADA